MLRRRSSTTSVRVRTAVRQRFLSRNGRGAYIDFDESAERQSQNGPDGTGNSSGAAATPRTGMNREMSLTLASSTRAVARCGQADYQYSGAGFRTNDRSRLK